MQKPISTVQFTSPNPAPPTRAKAPEADSGQFNQALNREMAQRQPVPEAAPKQAAKQDKPAAPARPAAPEQARKAEQARKVESAEKSKQADSAKAAADAAEAADGAATASPVADMLALVAQFNQPQQAAAEVASEAALPAAGGQNLQAQLTVLQSAFGKLQSAMPAADGETPAQQAADGKLFNMMARMEPGSVDEAHDQPGKPMPAAAADAQPRAGADTGVVPGRTDFAQVIGRERGAEAVKTDTAVSAPLSAAVQQGSLATAQVATAGASDKIPARVGTPGWDNQVAQKIIYMVGGSEMSATLTLNPPDLGPMQVVLNVTNDHADVTFMSAQPEVRQALEDAMPKLREMMSESGIALGDASVNDGAHHQAQEEPARAGRTGAAPSAPGSAVEAEAQLVARSGAGRELPGLVNTFA